MPEIDAMPDIDIAIKQLEKQRREKKIYSFELAILAILKAQKHIILMLQQKP